MFTDYTVFEKNPTEPAFTIYSEDGVLIVALDHGVVHLEVPLTSNEVDDLIESLGQWVVAGIFDREPSSEPFAPFGVDPESWLLTNEDDDPTDENAFDDNYIDHCCCRDCLAVRDTR